MTSKRTEIYSEGTVYVSQVPKVQHTIDSIQSGKIQVKSEAEKHCSGG